MTVLDLPRVTDAFAAEDRPADADTRAAVERFYFREARLLDRERYQDWLDQCLDPDIHYWMPDMDTRRRDDPRGTFAPGEVAYFDDTIEELRVRVARFAHPAAWADNPATRHVHLIGNVEVFEADPPGCVAAFCVWTNIRNRNETDQDILHGRRDDLLRRVGDGFRVLRRRILTVQNVLLTKNLNTFF